MRLYIILGAVFGFIFATYTQWEKIKPILDGDMLAPLVIIGCSILGGIIGGLIAHKLIGNISDYNK